MLATENTGINKTGSSQFPEAVARDSTSKSVHRVGEVLDYMC